jgi:signal transduction histidine kinase
MANERDAAVTGTRHTGAVSSPPTAPPDRLRVLLRDPEKLSRIERVTVLGAVGIGLAAGVVVTIVNGTDDLGASLFEIAVTAAFALFVWSPVAATLVLGGALTMSFFVDLADMTLLAFAIAAGCVTRTGSAPLVIGYASVLVVAAAAIGQDPTTTPGIVTGYVLVAAALSGVGLALRAAHARSRRLDEALAGTARREREAIVADRRRIAGDLHDSIAHDLTVIALHSQLLDEADAEVRRSSEETIRQTALDALRDLRSVIETAGDGLALASRASNSLRMTFEESRHTLASVGYDVTVTGTDAPANLPPDVDMAFARILRESVTNVLKHGGRGRVDIDFEARPELARLVVRSPLAGPRRRVLPSGGTGLVRMRQRVVDLGGQFEAGVQDGVWRVTIQVPLGPSPSEEG